MLRYRVPLVWDRRLELVAPFDLEVVAFPRTPGKKRAVKGYLTASLLVGLLGCASPIPDGRLTPYQAQFDQLKINYTLPGSSRLTAGPPEQNIEFFQDRSYPLSGHIATVGWEFRRDVPQVQMSLGLVKISTPRFGRAVPATDWESILREERVSRLVGNRIRIVRDANNQVWQETTFESNGRITDRAYARPIAPDILILLRLNFREQVSQGQRANALMIQEAMLSTVTIEPVNTSSGPQMQGKKPSQSRNP